MQVKITTNRLNSLREGAIITVGEDAEMDRKMKVLIENGEAVIVGEKIEISEPELIPAPEVASEPIVPKKPIVKRAKKLK